MEYYEMSDSDKQIYFLRLFEPLRESLSRFALAKTNNREDAKDLVSETVLRAYTNLEKLKDERCFLSYLFSIASNIYKRQSRRKKLFGIFESEKLELIKDNGNNPETKTDVIFLYKALKKLPDKICEAIILFEISGLSIEEIAEIQGGTISGVKSRLKRGREKLADLLGVKESKQQHKNIIENYSYREKSSKIDINTELVIQTEKIYN